MRRWHSLLRTTFVIALLSAPLAMVQPAQAQLSVAIGIGPVYGYPAPVAVYGPPVCEYGYYSYYPYSCAPYGYYGADWFDNGVFIGAGPWFRGWYGRPWGWGFDDMGYYGWYGQGFWDGDGWGGYGDGWRGGYGDGWRGGWGDRARYYGGGRGGTYFGGRPGNYRGGGGFRGGHMVAGNNFRQGYGGFHGGPQRAFGYNHGFHTVSNFGGVGPARNFGGGPRFGGIRSGGMRPMGGFHGGGFHGR